MKMEGQNSRIVAAALMPHAPVLIPAVGRGREREAEATVNSLRWASRRLLASKPARLVVVSPHSPRRPGWFGWWGRPRLRGSLDRFGCPGLGVDLPNDLEYLDHVRREASALGIGLWEIQDRELDHGALVPLSFLAE